MRSLLPCWFSSWDPREEMVQLVLSAGVFLPLQGFDRRGRYCFLIRTLAIVLHGMAKYWQLSYMAMAKYWQLWEAIKVEKI